MDESVYYKTPIGIFQIKSSGHVISAVTYVNKQGRPEIKESDVEFIEPRSAIIKKCMEQFDQYFAGTLFEFDLDLGQEGTVFQKQVWDELLNIKFGKTESYLGLSKKIGNVKAIRAVGTANGRNSINIIVPCHRVIGSNGSLVGYGGDLWRKKWLLEHEAKYANGVQTLF